MVVVGTGVTKVSVSGAPYPEGKVTGTPFRVIDALPGAPRVIVNPLEPCTLCEEPAAIDPAKSEPPLELVTTVQHAPELLALMTAAKRLLGTS